MVLCRLIQRYGFDIKKVLVVGCGSGREAVVISTQLSAEVFGIDLVEAFDPEAAKQVTLRRGDARALEFEDGSFDLVYSYHALEHIEQPEVAVGEMRRVLRDGGGCLIGTPNRHRVLGYLGAEGSWSQRVAWNLDDWCRRLQNRFRNELGAHAGFSRSELSALLGKCFSRVDDLTLEYFRSLYSRHRARLDTIAWLRLSDIILPSAYFIASSQTRESTRAADPVSTKP